MNANLVSILSWSRPYKTGAVLLSVNTLFWILAYQRPICVMSLAGVCFYLRYLWKHRIRPEVLVDPPDSEDWVTLSSYEFEQQYITFTKKIWSLWINLRTENHLMWTCITCTMWIFLAKLGSQVDFITLLFVISNAAFLLFPLLKVCPSLELPAAMSEGVIKEEDLIPEVPKKTSKSSKRNNSPPKEPDLPKTSSAPFEPEAPHPVRIPEQQSRSSPRRMSPTLSTSLTEGMLTRSMAAAAANFVTSGFTNPSSVMSASAAVISGFVSQASSQLASEPSVRVASKVSDTSFGQREASPALDVSGPDSLTPGVTTMPDHEEDSDPEDDFLFDAKHFDKSSSSSSTSNSFEIINNI